LARESLAMESSYGTDYDKHSNIQRIDQNYQDFGTQYSRKHSESRVRVWSLSWFLLHLVAEMIASTYTSINDSSNSIPSMMLVIVCCQCTRVWVNQGVRDCGTD
jgi:hypothetical protein